MLLVLLLLPKGMLRVLLHVSAITREERLAALGLSIALLIVRVRCCVAAETQIHLCCWHVSHSFIARTAGLIMAPA